MSKEEIYDRMIGCLYGQAIGDALGLCSEFMSKKEVTERFSPMLRYYNQFYPSGLGVWQDDDTKQMLCLLDELIANGKIEHKSLARRLLNWLETDGFGCGNLVYQVLTHQDYTAKPIEVAKEHWELSHRESAPNGAIMRTSVIGLWKDDIDSNAATACMVTHYDPRCIGSCVIASQVINHLVWHNRELSYDEILKIADRYDSRIGEWIELAKNGSLDDLCLDEPHGIGYTLRTLACALWCYWHSTSFEDGLLAVVNEGGDADTNAAIACSILGAKFGYKNIPTYYVENLYNEKEYRAKCENFIKHA
ncbi:ADP-ribosylglycohydrolase family protein [uncultured Duncaniella sp.]|jgi:ADP-ribosylglycohydrolase|uniref:ADP-ribosylglycohydrolase family protein n=2 Tax=uncultured Duncaniella sp. TaxID=2768039 RepID=UPI000F46F63A|nr:ADP-ribosylglycohydrolase family protein [uncultured Duncaniella sp.]ROS90423.1 ADP-ribosylglycohydrolase family protein [Muribaculaceae bacterium Isolate-080 (Janvier)]